MGRDSLDGIYLVQDRAGDSFCGHTVMNMLVP